jgi:hypothetical protein
MEMPITKPSMVSYADEVDFAQLLEKLSKNRHNGFIRITSGSDEGYILFENGKELAASYDRYAKSEAIDYIKSAVEKADTVIEIFDLRPSNIDYLTDLNKPYLMEQDYDINKVIEELKSRKTDLEPSITEEPEDMQKPEPKNANQVESESSLKKETPVPKPEIVTESKTAESEPISESKTLESKPITDSKPSETEPISESKVTKPESKPETPSELESVKSEPESISESESLEPKSIPDLSESESQTSGPEKASEQDKTSIPDSVVSEGESKTVESEIVTESEIAEPVHTHESEPSEPVSKPSQPQTNSDEPVTVSTSEQPAEKVSNNSVPKTEIQGTDINKEVADQESDLDTDKFVEKDESSSKYVDSKKAIKDELKTMESKPQTEVDTKTGEEEKPVDRSKLMQKYGIKEMNEDDVEDLLDTYKGGSLNDEDVEKIELALMNKIKKSIFGIPKIKGAEVMVFLENATELTGDINIIIEYETQGFFSRLIGESKSIENLRRQVINIAQIEIKKSFRKYPEIVNKFNINVEIS